MFACYYRYSMNNFGGKVGRWLDECKMALQGVVLATRDVRFVAGFLISFVVFGTLMNLLSGSTAAVNLFWVTDWAGKFNIIKDAFLGIFGVGRSFWDWLLTFCIILLQSILIGLVVFVWQKRRRSRKGQLAADVSNADNLQSAGLVTGLAILGSGCPTCGTTLLAPLIGTMFSSGSFALAGAISGILTAIAIIVALLALKKMGKDAYAIVLSERHHQRKKLKENKT